MEPISAQSELAQLCKSVKYIAFDADDTLWHTESIFTSTETQLMTLLQDQVDPQNLKQRLAETERKNLRLFGYGVKGFTLSMIETALELTDYQIKGQDIQKIIQLGKEMLDHPLETLPDIPDTLHLLKPHFTLMIITKGDLFDQENKIARSGLADYFDHVEIVSEKNPENYQTIWQRYQIVPDQFLMIGNSPKSDILPVLERGGRAIFVPYEVTWVHEQAEINPKKYPDHHFLQLPDLSLLRQMMRTKTA